MAGWSDGLVGHAGMQLQPLDAAASRGTGLYARSFVHANAIVSYMI